MRTITLTTEQHELVTEMVADAIRASLPPRFTRTTGQALIGAAQEYAEAEFLAMSRAALAGDSSDFDAEDAAADAEGEADLISELADVYRALLKGGV